MPGLQDRVDNGLEGAAFLSVRIRPVAVIFRGSNRIKDDKAEEVFAPAVTRKPRTL